MVWTNCRNNSGSCKAEADMECREQFTPLQDETNTLPHHLCIPVCLVMDHTAGGGNPFFGDGMLTYNLTHPRQGSRFRKEICNKLRAAVGPFEELLLQQRKKVDMVQVEIVGDVFLMFSRIPLRSPDYGTSEVKYLYRTFNVKYQQLYRHIKFFFTVLNINLIWTFCQRFPY